MIPQYCTVYPVLRITEHNRQQNIMAAFLARKLAWVFWKGMVGEERWKFVAKKGKASERKC